ncbi:hypothetical protein BX666DRAFT_2016764 [Dichotomocladium elegans]|nr:hypothetical protein BX666DRAFT_2016764 [Dichotomocladium elegans]
MSSTVADAGVWNPETFSLTTRILQQNPDYYTIWNIRRRCLVGMHGNDNKAIPRATFQSELQFFMLLTRINPKSYWLWNHRRWCLETMPEPDWVAELGLVEKLLAMDARNFHGWDYRRYVVDQMRTGNHEKDMALAQGEYDFTTKKIKQSFSNFSAWHNRTRLLPEIVADMSPEEKNELVKAAIYTDPDDQSAWIYYRWVVGRCKCGF